MDLQIRKALEEIVHSFDTDNIALYKYLRESLETILTVLQQQYDAIKQAHANEVAKLQDVIVSRQLEIQMLKSSRQIKNETKTIKNESVTPYRILLKSGKKNNTNLNKENTARQQPSLVEEVFAGINISDKKEYRFSLQIGPSGGKRSVHTSSSNIKNKIVNQRQDKSKTVLSPRPFGQENQLLSYASNFNRPGELTKCQSLTDKISPRLQQVEQQLSVINVKQRKDSEIGSKRSSIQEKVKLCRKPSTRSKRELLRKKQLQNPDTARIRCVDVMIPIKTINVTALKPR